MDSSRPFVRPTFFLLAAVAWAAVGLGLLGRPADSRPNAVSPVIPPEEPGLRDRAPATVPVVTVHDPQRTAPGLNLVTAGDAELALLLDPDGTELHRWHRALADLVDAGVERRTGTWERARLLADGRLLVIVGGVGLVAFDRDSNVLWKGAKGAHDDLDVLPDGRIAVLVREVRHRQDLSRGRVIIEDVRVVLDPDGQRVSSLSLVDALLGSPFDTWRIEPLNGEILQTTVMESVSPVRVLLAMRRPGTLSILDVATERITWSKTGDGSVVSDAEVLADGGLLLVETVAGTARSRVVERDPETLAVRTSRDLRSASGGVVQRLANGNTLITSGDDGGTMEVAPDGAVVWALGPSARGSSPLTPYETERVPAELRP